MGGDGRLLAPLTSSACQRNPDSESAAKWNVTKLSAEYPSKSSMDLILYFHSIQAPYWQKATPPPCSSPPPLPPPTTLWTGAQFLLLTLSQPVQGLLLYLATACWFPRTFLTNPWPEALHYTIPLPRILSSITLTSPSLSQVSEGPRVWPDLQVNH